MMIQAKEKKIINTADFLICKWLRRDKCVPKSENDRLCMGCYSRYTSCCMLFHPGLVHLLKPDHLSVPVKKVDRKKHY